ncbi:hypothetical protein [Listeria monocytogenes]|uniref:hypothetical protein n=1 Tax=Listeria monocytogenes TaxID=1639 RepID=UPI001552FDEB|nr:hypothetical protein [Listeria monocytogenes]EHT9644885.1 hypothetical protein [Listeria monocytogenes]EHV5872987.1 hypothetical protein [Listeria monocytogenes]EIB7889053.1 hypothetical protein [Listeria monocytogenes]EIB7905191.1 hypothetical protein [Listeria monocytogenes]EIR6789674.1 hypothetical protein [Listeria monocytogenes]
MGWNRAFSGVWFFFWGFDFWFLVVVVFEASLTKDVLKLLGRIKSSLCSDLY